MRLIGKGFSVNGKADLVGTVMACWDNGNHTGFEDTVNLSNLKDREKLISKLVSALTVGLEEARSAVTNLLIQLREASNSVETNRYSDAVDEERKSQATLLVGLALAMDVELWHTPEGECFASFLLNDHPENWPVRSRGFRDFLAHLFFVQKAKVPGAQAVQDALSVLGGKALFEGQEHEVYTHVAEYENKIYIDLVNDLWEVVEISPLGWAITTEPPVRFRRTGGMLALPIPEKSGGLGPLRELLNIPEDSDWALFAGCLIQAFRPKGPYPVLVIHGEHGSAKTTTCRVFRALIDPHKADLRPAPRDERDLIIKATNSWVVGLDNLSHVPSWLSDALCRLSTGGGFGTRQLYTDNEEQLFYAQRPVIVNGIEEVTTRADLMDRSVILYLPAIEEDKRKTEAQFWAEFETCHGSILGGLLDAVVVGLRSVNTTSLARSPRMADFALWATAAEPGLDLKPGEFIYAYNSNRKSANETTLEASPIVPYLRRLVNESPQWEGTSSEMLQKLDSMATEKEMKLKSWPKAANALSNKLRGLTPNLRAVGIEVIFGRTDEKRLVLVRRVGEKDRHHRQERHPESEEPEDLVSAADGDAGPSSSYRGSSSSQLQNDAPDGDDDVFATPSLACKNCGGLPRGSGVSYLPDGGLLCPDCGRR